MTETMTGLDRFVFSFLNLKVMLAWAPKVLGGLLVTVELAVLVVVAGIAAGLALALMRTLGWRMLNGVIIFGVDVFRAVPPLVIIVLLFFGLPSAGIEVSGFTATWLSLTCVLAAFAEEIFWAAIRAVPPGQAEAARSLGLGYGATMRHVVLPQAWRIAVPPLTNRTIAVTKGTALGSVVGLSEILGASQSAMSFSGNPSPLVLGAAAYVLLFTPVIAGARWLETRFGWVR